MNIDVGYLKNCYETDVNFPAHLIYRDLIFVDDWRRTSLDIMKRHGIRYFKCFNVMKFPDNPDINIVFARIHRWESGKMHDVLEELQNLNTATGATSTYMECCEKLKGLLLQWKNEKEEERINRKKWRR